jgi:hypothetical protein
MIAACGSSPAATSERVQPIPEASPEIGGVFTGGAELVADARPRPLSPPPTPLAAPEGKQPIVDELVRNYDRFAACAAKDPGATGTISNHFVVDGHGAVVAIRTEGDGNAAVHGCMTAAVHQLAFRGRADGKAMAITWNWTLRHYGPLP